MSIGRKAAGGEAPAKDERFGDVPWIPAGIVALALFLLYVFTLGPSTAMWDTSEYITAAKVFGVPHPPGNPVFVIFAHAFGLHSAAHRVRRAHQPHGRRHQRARRPASGSSWRTACCARSSP